MHSIAVRFSDNERLNFWKLAGLSAGHAKSGDEPEGKLFNVTKPLALSLTFVKHKILIHSRCMPKSEQEKGWETFRDWTVIEILKYRARFIQVCYKAILPKELYDLAKDNKEMDRCSRWAKDNGWKFMQKGESLLLLKNGKVLGEFRPLLEGGKLDPHLEFYAQIAGEKLELVRPEESSPNGILDLITKN